MESDIAQLVEMGATRAQARAALQKYKDVMQAAERFFEGEFENVTESMSVPPSTASSSKPTRIAQVCIHVDARGTRLVRVEH
jgi:hypothetical protein